MKSSCLLSLLLVPSLLIAATASEDWAALVALDAGPQKRPASAAEARTIAVEHIARQERALREFLREHPGDEHAFEAKLRLARALQLKADVQDNSTVSREIEALIKDAERTARPEQRADVRFSRISYAMRAMRTPNAQQRQQLYDMARSFEASFPEDRRVAALLAEVATRFDHDPKRKRELLLAAQTSARDEELKSRIADDFKRVELLGQPISLRFEPAQGAPLDLTTYHGKVVVLVFFSGWSQPAMEAIDKIEKAAAKLPADQVQIFGVSLDTKPEALESLVRQRKIKWPIICDGKGWESPLVRRLGINALPTVWLLDREGRLVSLDGLDGFSSQVHELMTRR